MQHSLHQQLREQTRDQHERLHEIVEVNQLVISPQSYGSALQAYLRAVAPLEEFMTSFSSSHCLKEMPDAGARLQKTEWLCDDLDSLGLSVPETDAPSVNYPVSSSPEAAYVGFAYVTEGMTLGAMQVSKHIYRALQFTAENGARFFNGYGSRTLERWQGFKKYLSEVTLSEQEVVEAAGYAFSRFEQELSAYRTLSLSSEGEK